MLGGVLGALSGCGRGGEAVVKVFYCMRAMSGMEKEVWKRRVWLIVSNREVTELDL